jgi:hypothetical protein
MKPSMPTRRRGRLGLGDVQASDLQRQQGWYPSESGGLASIHLVSYRPEQWTAWGGEAQVVRSKPVTSDAHGDT